MKKILTITATFLVALLPLIFVFKTTFAEKKRIQCRQHKTNSKKPNRSVLIFAAQAQNRGIGNVSDFEVEKVEIDDLSMAHTSVRQTVDNIPVWEGEAIVHLKSDGALSTITDDLKENISVNTQPNFSEKDAYNLAIGMYEGKAELGGGTARSNYISIAAKTAIIWFIALKRRALTVLSHSPLRLFSLMHRRAKKFLNTTTCRQVREVRFTAER